MKCLFLSIVLILAFPFAQEERPLRSAAQIIKEEGQLIVADNSSYYLFKADGSFESGPVGISGRTIVGRWKQTGSPNHFVIEGKWEWINGLSPIDDYRRMTLIIGAANGFEQKESIPVATDPEPGRVYNCYLLVEELVKLQQSEWSR
jgi:hypothetical protein